jgi:putative ABC transport system permease protein
MGRMWTESEEERSAKVVMLGHDAAEDLFPDGPRSARMSIAEGSMFTVIGVLDKQPQPFGSGRNTQDNAAYFPLETFRQLRPEIKDFWITVKYDDPAHKDMVSEEIRELLAHPPQRSYREGRQLRHLQPRLAHPPMESLTGGFSCLWSPYPRSA